MFFICVYIFNKCNQKENVKLYKYFILYRVKKKILLKNKNTKQFSLLKIRTNVFLNVIRLLVALFLFITLYSLQQHQTGTQQFSHE